MNKGFLLLVNHQDLSWTVASRAKLSLSIRATVSRGEWSELRSCCQGRGQSQWERNNNKNNKKQHETHARRLKAEGWGWKALECALARRATWLTSYYVTITSDRT